MYRDICLFRSLDFCIFPDIMPLAAQSNVVYFLRSVSVPQERPATVMNVTSNSEATTRAPAVYDHEVPFFILSVRRARLGT